MMRSTLPSKGMPPSSGLGAEIGYTRSMTHEVLKTEPTGLYQCTPATKPVSEISWRTVFLPLLDRLSELQSRPESERWPAADWPSEAAFKDAVAFIDRLPVPLRASPYISLADDGEVNFAWTQEGMLIDLGFYGSGAYSFYARGQDGEKWFGDDISVMSPLPKALRALLAG